MKRIFLALFVTFFFFPLNAFCADTGGVNTGVQKFSGTKIFRDMALTDSTLTGNITLSLDSTRFQRLDPGGSHRNVTLPASAENQGLWFYFINAADAAENLVIKDSGGNTIVTIQQSQVAFVASSYSAWKGAAFGAAFAGGLQADGTVAGATGQAQDFGTNGIKADVIAESTEATGVTIDGLLIKDNAIATLANTTLNSVNIDAGASGTAGTVDIFPSTGSKGKLALTAADSAGDTTTTIVNASQAGARTYTIPDAGASASFVMTAGNQTITGTKTIAALVTTNIDAGASGTAGTVDVFPTTGSKGKIAITAADNTGDTTTTIVNAEQAGARTYTIPDAGASASFVMTEGAQTVNGILTAGAANIITHAPTGLKVQDSDASHVVTLAPGDESANRTLSIPVLGGADTIVTLGTAQSITGVKTMSGANIIKMANTGLTLLDTGADHTTQLKQNSNEAANRTLNIPALGGDDTLVTLGVNSTFTGAITFGSAAGKFVRTSQRYKFNGGWKVGGTAGWTVAAADNVLSATCPASQTSAKLIVPLPGLHVGDIITAFGLVAQIESGGNNVTLDADLRVSTAAAGDFTDNSVGTITQIAVTADTKVDSTQDKASLNQTIAQDEAYYMVITATTNASTDIDLRAVSVVVSQQ